MYDFPKINIGKTITIDGHPLDPNGFLNEITIRTIDSSSNPLVTVEITLVANAEDVTINPHEVPQDTRIHYEVECS